jgi:hypothetical protein
MPTINGVWYEELNTAELKSPILVTGLGRIEGTRYLKCNWDDRFKIETAFLGEEVWKNDQLVAFSDPQPFPGKEELEAQQSRIVGLGSLGYDLDKAQKFQLAIITLTYGPKRRSRDIPGEKGSGITNILASQELDFGGEIFVYGNDVWKYNTSGALIKEGVPKLMQELRSTYTLYGAKTLNVTTYANLTGKINAAAFPKNAKASQQAAAETLLFDGASTTRQITAKGDLPYDITLQFRHRAQSWQQLYDPANDRWDLVVPKGGGAARLYETGDFEALLLR